MNIFEWITNIDVSILYWMQENLRSDVLTIFFKAVTSLSDMGWFWLTISIILLLFPKTRKTGVLSLVSFVVSAIIINIGIKPIVARPRPFDYVDYLVPLIKKPWDYSFPSGHTGAAFSVALILWNRLDKKYSWIFVVIAILIGFSRLYLGVHYPSDVLFGFIVSLVVALVVIKKGSAFYGSDRN